MKENSISFIEKNSERFNKCTVLYGDTDSIFINVPSCNKEEAFKVGQQICDEISKINPQPIKLKFEKVYHPAILITKKRFFLFFFIKIYYFCFLSGMLDINMKV